MKIVKMVSEKKKYLDLLLLGDEEEAMIDKYIDKGEVFCLYDEELRGIIVLTFEGNGIYEIKNLAIYERYQRQGYGKKLIENSIKLLKGRGKTLLVGTGDGTSTVDFYKKCGFLESHKIKNFFIDNYPNPIYEGKTRLIHMLYLKMEL